MTLVLLLGGILYLCCVSNALVELCLVQYQAGLDTVLRELAPPRVAGAVQRIRCKILNM